MEYFAHLLYLFWRHLSEVCRIYVKVHVSIEGVSCHLDLWLLVLKVLHPEFASSLVNVHRVQISPLLDKLLCHWVIPAYGIHCSVQVELLIVHVNQLIIRVAASFPLLRFRLLRLGLLLDDFVCEVLMDS
jgi:hypothetical protein